MPGERVAVLGAGGPSGSLVVHQLVKDGKKTVAVVRNPDKYAGKFPQSELVEVKQGDVTDSESLKAVLKGCSHVVFAASGGTYWSAKETDYLGVKNTAEAADKGAHIVLITSALVSPHNRFSPIRILLNNIRWSLMDYKFQGEEALRAEKRVTHTIVRPGGLTNDIAGKGKIVVRQGDNGSPGRISRADLADVVVAAINNRNSHQKTVEVAVDNTIKPNPNDFAHLFDDAKPLSS